MPMRAPTNVIAFRPKAEKPNAIERAFDEMELAQAAAKREARQKAKAHVSEYLTRPLRTEAEARAQSGKAHAIFENILSVWRP